MSQEQVEATSPDKWLEHRRPDSPVSSNVSMKSERSMGEPPSFRNEEPGLFEDKRPVSSVSSNASMKSERSKGEPPSFREEEPGWLEPERPDSPVSSNVSMKSERSMGEHPNFRNEEPGLLEDKRPVSSVSSNASMKSERSKGEPPSFREEEPGLFEDKRPASPVPSNASMKSERSKGEPPSFRNEEPGWLEPERPDSPVSSNVSMKSERSMGEHPNFRNEEPGLLEDKRPVSSVSSNASMKSERSKGEPPSFRNEEPGWLEPERPDSPVSSNVSMKSERSMGEHPNFRNEEPGLLEDKRPVSSVSSNASMKSERSKGEPPSFREEEPGLFEDKRPASPVPSNASMKSERSKGEPPSFRNEEPGWLEPERPDSPVSSNVSMKSERSMGEHPNFRNEEPGLLEDKRPVSSVSSNASMKSERSKGEPPSFRNEEPGWLEPERPDSPVSSNVSMKSERSMGEHPNFRNEESGPLEDKRPVSSVSSNASMKSERSKGEPPSFREEEPGASKKTGHNPSKEKEVKDKLRAGLKQRILSQHEETQKLETDTEIYEIQADKSEKAKAQTFDQLFRDVKKNEVRTVLMKGVAGIGKTTKTSLFMVDWAKGKSNKNIDFIVSLKFSELNSKSDKVQTMKDLLRHSINDKQGVYKYDNCKVAFILDGLEECKLPLDFAKNKELTGMEKPATMDVLLTNLIKGNLLPSARLWITSRPSGVDKIPLEYIDKVTECQETSKRWQRLASELRKRLHGEITQNEHSNHPNQKDTEHIIKEVRSGEVNNEEKNGCPAATSVIPVTSVSDIFKGKEGQKIRTVLTTGEADIGKSFHVQKFLKEWAKNDNKNFFRWLIDAAKETIYGKEEAVVFPLRVSELNSMKKEEVSLMGLLNHLVKETKEFVISNFEHLRVLFVLDGLDAYELPLDFDNNKTLTDVREPASVDVLLTNLIRGNLLPSAQLWITSRQKLPDAHVDRMTEIRCKPDVASKQMLKFQLKEQFTHVSEGMDMQKTTALLNEIYTDLYIIEGERGEVNAEHEVKHIQGAKFKPEGQETSITYNNIFKQVEENKPKIRTVLTLGVAGIGKSFATKKYMLDWAEDKDHKDVFYMFPLSFRELNLRKEQEHSMEDLIHQFCPAMRTSEITDYKKYRILIVLDGLDECRLKLDFDESNNWTEMRKPTSVNVLLTNLIQGNLLSEAQIWITSRPAASSNIPAQTVDRVTEVRGFNDEQKEEYFRRRFSDKDLAEKILSHVRESRSLYIMCHIPVFCWITAKVLEDFVNRKQERMPKTLTDMYIHFLVIQCLQANVKYGEGETSEDSDTDECWNSRNKETIMSLGKLAFKGLKEGNLVFTEENLTECDVDTEKAAGFSGIFTQITRKGPGQCQQKLFCFVHLSIHEFLAAFHVFHTFNNTGKNLLTTPEDLPAADFYKAAVDMALDSQTGDWDLFLRFLLGLSLETNQNLLQELLKKTENSKKTNDETIHYIKGKIQEENSDADKNCDLFYCLNELNDHSLVEEVKTFLRSETSFENFSTSQWSALTFVLLTSDEKLDIFDLKQYLKSEKVLLGMLPVVKVSETALLNWCELSEKSCRGLSSSVLSSVSNNLTELNLSHNDLLDSGVQMLADGLQSIHCKLKILKLSGCQVTEKGCSFLASALRSKNASTLTHLDLSYNHPGAKGKKMLSDIAADPKTSLETLCLEHDGAHRLKPGMKKYGVHLKLDENTAGKRLCAFEEERKVKTVEKVEEMVPRPENIDRFKRTQVICEEGLKGICYWEVEWEGTVGIAVTYKAVSREQDSSGGLGCNDMSWSLLCSKSGYTPLHGKNSKDTDTKKQESKDTNTKKHESKDIGTKKQESKDIGAKKKESKDIGTTKQESKDIGAKKQESKDIGTKKQESKDIGAKKQESKDIGTKKQESKDIGAKKQESKDIGTKKQESKDIGAKKQESKDIGTKKQESKDIGTKKQESKDIGTKKKETKDIGTKKKESKDIGAKKEPKVPLCHKIAVLLDWESGTLTYYGVTSGKLSHIHTFHAEFTEPLFPGFWFQRGCVTLCKID